jgi:trans-L-3-hydroxyproline dehydratase
MSVKVAEQARFGPHAAVRPEVGGDAHYSGQHEFWIEPDDPLGAGFLVR